MAITGTHRNGPAFFGLRKPREEKPDGAPAKTSPPIETVRCAIYTRKSNHEGLDQDFTSLDAQKESAESYIASPKHRGWYLLPERYENGGFSGGTMDRPASQRLLSDIEAGRIDCVVAYKYDRLSRSILDFLQLMETFENQRGSFVSVTEQFDTTTPMGRLMLNMLLSFAQFERELAAEQLQVHWEAPAQGQDLSRRTGSDRIPKTVG